MVSDSEILGFNTGFQLWIRKCAHVCVKSTRCSQRRQQHVQVWDLSLYNTITLVPLSAVELKESESSTIFWSSSLKLLKPNTHIKYLSIDHSYATVLFHSSHLKSTYHCLNPVWILSHLTSCLLFKHLDTWHDKYQMAIWRGRDHRLDCYS